MFYLYVQVKTIKDIDSNTFKSHLDELVKIDDINKAVQISNTLLEAMSSYHGSTLDQKEIRKVKIWSVMWLYFVFTETF